MGCIFLQTLSEVEDSLREFEQRVTELKARAEGQSDQISNQELLKLQVYQLLCGAYTVTHCDGHRMSAQIYHFNLREYLFLLYKFTTLI